MSNFSQSKQFQNSQHYTFEIVGNKNMSRKNRSILGILDFDDMYTDDIFPPAYVNGESTKKYQQEKSSKRVVVEKQGRNLFSNPPLNENIDNITPPSNFGQTPVSRYKRSSRIQHDHEELLRQIDENCRQDLNAISDPFGDFNVSGVIYNTPKRPDAIPRRRRVFSNPVADENIEDISPPIFMDVPETPVRQRRQPSVIVGDISKLLRVLDEMYNENIDDISSPLIDSNASNGQQSAPRLGAVQRQNRSLSGQNIADISPPNFMDVPDSPLVVNDMNGIYRVLNNMYKEELREILRPPINNNSPSNHQIGPRGGVIPRQNRKSFNVSPAKQDYKLLASSTPKPIIAKRQSGILFSDPPEAENIEDITPPKFMNSGRSSSEHDRIVAQIEQKFGNLLGKIKRSNVQDLNARSNPLFDGNMSTIRNDVSNANPLVNTHISGINKSSSNNSGKNGILSSTRNDYEKLVQKMNENPAEDLNAISIPLVDSNSWANQRASTKDLSKMKNTKHYRKTVSNETTEEISEITPPSFFSEID